RGRDPAVQPWSNLVDNSTPRWVDLVTSGCHNRACWTTPRPICGTEESGIRPAPGHRDPFIGIDDRAHGFPGVMLSGRPPLPAIRRDHDGGESREQGHPGEMGAAVTARDR